MKILLLSDYASPIGGSELTLLALRDGLRRRGHDVRLFASRAVGDGGTADYRCYGTTSSFRTLLQSGNPSALFKLRQILAGFKPDIAHVQLFLTQLSPLIMPLLRHTPTLYYAVWYRAICPLGSKMLPDGRPCHFPAGRACHRQGCLPLHDWLPLMGQMALFRRWRPVFDQVAANSTAVQQSLIAAGITPVTVIEHGVNAAPPAAVPLAPYPLLVFAGRLVPEKGVDRLIAAFAPLVAQYPDARLLIAGTGPEQDRLAGQAAALDLGDYVSFLGHLPQNEMDSRFAPAWVQVVPSRWAEPFGMVAAEAMMRGTAVIASDTGGLATIVRSGETGLLVPPGDVEQLTAALLRLLADETLRQQMGIRGRAIAQEQYSCERFVARMEAAYHNLLEKA